MFLGLDRHCYGAQNIKHVFVPWDIRLCVELFIASPLHPAASVSLFQYFYHLIITLSIFRPVSHQPFKMPSHTSTTFLLALAGAALSSAAIITTHKTVATRQAVDFSGDTQNFQDGVCADTMVIFARGTTEGGNVGALTGPPFFEALADQAGANSLAVQGVEYPADIAGFLAGGDAEGSALMAQLVQDTVGACPDSKVIMSGYSQGGQLVHNAAAMLPADVASQVAGAVIFGDPSKFVVVALSVGVCDEQMDMADKAAQTTVTRSRASLRTRRWWFATMETSSVRARPSFWLHT